MPKIKLNEDEHKLIIRYREQARAFNEGIAAALAVLSRWEGNLVRKDGLEKVEWDALLDDVAKQRKDTP